MVLGVGVAVLWRTGLGIFIEPAPVFMAPCVTTQPDVNRDLIRMHFSWLPELFLYVSRYS